MPLHEILMSLLYVLCYTPLNGQIAQSTIGDDCVVGICVHYGS